MNIGFDAKRLFFNTTGLGNYSRDLVKGLLKYHPEIPIHLFTPSKNSKINLDTILSNKNVNIHLPKGINSLIKSYWRSFKLEDDLLKNKIDIYHGLSNEIPQHRPNSSIKYVVTIHDLIFLNYPEFYSPIDRAIYNKKFQYAANSSDVVVAISQQTKQDLIDLYNISSEKIKVIYQSCDESFKHEVASTQLEKIKKKYKLPDNYILNVGTIEERKNLEILIKSIQHIDIPLVVIGKKTDYFKKTIAPLITKLNLNKRVTILDTVTFEDFPAIYQGANVFVYPSKYEGFGIPILESLYSKTPVITSKVSSLPEVGGNASLYIENNSAEQLTDYINKLLSDVYLRNKMIVDGYQHALTFSEQSQADNIYDIYKQLL